MNGGQLDLWGNVIQPEPKPIVVASYERRPAGKRARERVETSLEGLAHAIDTGSRASHMEHVADFLARVPGQTASEIAAGVGLDAVEVRRRLNDLLNANLARKGEARLATGRRVREMTWYLT